MEDKLFRRTATGIGRNLCFQLLFGHQIMISFLHLHGITKRPGGSRNNGNLLDRSRVCLLRGNQGMTDLMISYHQFFFIRQDCILFLISGNYHFNTFFQIRLCCIFSALPDSPQCSLIDNICKLRTTGSGSHTGNLFKIHLF